MIKIKGSALNDKFNPSTLITNLRYNKLPNGMNTFLLEKKHHSKNKVQFHVYNKNTKQSSFLCNSFLNNLTKDDTSMAVLPKLLPGRLKSLSLTGDQCLKPKKMIQSPSENTIINIKCISKGSQTNRSASIFPLIEREPNKELEYHPRRIPIHRQYKRKAVEKSTSCERVFSPRTFIKNKLISRMLKEKTIRKQRIVEIS